MEHEVRVTHSHRFAISFALVASGLAMAFAATGCVSDPSPQGEAPMCEVSSDCLSGEVCDEGVCYGNPPVGELAGVLVPSGESSLLVQTDIPNLSITDDGYIEGLTLATPVRLEGKVTLVCSQITSELGLDCGSDAPIDASIRVERAPAFPGGPRFSQTFVASADAGEGVPSFSFNLPPTLPDADGTTRKYQVTVTPLEPEDTSGPSAAEVAPPRIEIDFAADVDQAIEWKLGEPDATKWISGCVVSATQTVPSYAKDMPVAAFAPDPSTGVPVLVSSRGRTDNAGCYSLRVPSNLATVNLRFEPDGDGPAPTIEVIDEAIDGELAIADSCFGGSPSESVCIKDLLGPTLSTPLEVTVPITAQASEGGAAPVAGATVRMLAVLALPPDSDEPSRNNRVSASIDIRTTSSANNSPGQLGQATTLAPIGLTYSMSVVPANESKFAARIAEVREIVAGGVQEPIHLGRRVSVSGTILAIDGSPVEGATVVASPSSVFKFGQSETVRAVLDSLNTSATTRADGTFFFWLDGRLNLSGESLGDEIEYDLAINPSFRAGPPTRLTSVRAGDDGIDLGSVVLPTPARARGQIVDDLGAPAPGVGLHIWRPTIEDPCAAFSIPEGNCPTAAARLGVWVADDDAMVRIVLPNPLD